MVRVVPFPRYALLLIESRVEDAGPLELIKGVVDLGFCAAGATVHFNVRARWDKREHSYVSSATDISLH